MAGNHQEFIQSKMVGFRVPGTGKIWGFRPTMFLILIWFNTSQGRSKMSSDIFHWNKVFFLVCFLGKTQTFNWWFQPSPFCDPQTLEVTKPTTFEFGSRNLTIPKKVTIAELPEFATLFSLPTRKMSNGPRVGRWGALIPKQHPRKSTEPSRTKDPLRSTPPIARKRCRLDVHGVHRLARRLARIKIAACFVRYFKKRKSSLWYCSHWLRSLGGSFWKASICFLLECVFFCWNDRQKTITINFFSNCKFDPIWTPKIAQQVSLFSKSKKKRRLEHQGEDLIPDLSSKGTSRLKIQIPKARQKKKREIAPKKKIKNWSSKAAGKITRWRSRNPIYRYQNRDSLSPNLAPIETVQFFYEPSFKLKSVCFCSFLPNFGSKTLVWKTKIKKDFPNLDFFAATLDG